MERLFHSLADCIFPRRRSQEKKQEASLSEEETAIMVKKLVLSTG